MDFFVNFSSAKPEQAVNLNDTFFKISSVCFSRAYKKPIEKQFINDKSNSRDILKLNN